MTVMHGSCHCGALSVAFTTAKLAADFQPRACDCSFCMKHGAAYVSDPGGSLSIVQRHADAIKEYRQGSNTARFLLCKDCGVLVGVVFDHASGTYGTLNVTCLDDATGFAQALGASPQQLSQDEKISRWLALWVPRVVIETSAH
ncbi:MAG TPA: aldehyde-activating protein [Dyella sp.]|uniref:GFA family protein n=1 Tax=Dyella sp. TaxID=1869338 RepID=UPI002C555CF4|nr:aldehyde-activating protein [Dyella sp.]HTV86188.1 aldehyde-activating protein [Dyella sp.]